MRAPIGRTILRGIASEGASALAGIVLRIESASVARGLPLLTGIVVLTESRAAAGTGGAAVISGCARPGHDIRNEANAADEHEKSAKAGWVHDLDGLGR